MTQSAPREPGPLISQSLTNRLHALAKAFVETDLVCFRVSDDETEFEFRRSGMPPRVSDPLGAARNGATDAVAEPNAHDFVASDIVGIVHLTRPAVVEGSTLDGDRELAYVEALGIRNSVRSRGAGRVVSILCKDGDAVDYGRPLFAIDRTI